MHLLGKMFLRSMRAFHFWHEHNEEISLTLLVAGCLGFALSVFGIVSTEHRNVPFEWEHILGVATTAVFGFYLLLRTAGKFVARFWPPPVVSGITKNAQPIEKPEGEAWVFEDESGDRYRYRYARASDIDVFCRLAMSDPAIVTTYAYLGEGEWKALYERWFEADTHNLMVLEKLDGLSSTSSVHAVSIVVPLRASSARDLWVGVIGTVDITKEHMPMSGRQPDVLLLDFVAADRNVRSRCPELVFSLPKAHLAKRGLPKPRKSIEIWVEPVHRALPKILEQIGFDGPHRTAKGHTLYRFTLPPKTKHMSELQKQTSVRLQHDLKECAEWQVGN